jgi:putative ABC transport system substrate-binding protein
VAHRLAVAPLVGDRAPELDALLDGLRGLNYVEGRNLKVEAMWADGDQAMLPRLARAHRGTQGRRHLHRRDSRDAGREACDDDDSHRLRPRRVSGTDRPRREHGAARRQPDRRHLHRPEYGKRLELLREVAPRISRVTLLYNDQNTASVLAMRETQKWAKPLQVAVEPLGVHDRVSLDAAFSAMRRGRPDALMTTADALLASYRTLIVKFAGDRRLISMYGDREYVKAGGLMFYGTSNADMWRRAAIHVDRILKGTKPGDLPVEQPTKFELIINMAAAKSLGLAIPAAVRLRADEILD